MPSATFFDCVGNIGRSFKKKARDLEGEVRSLAQPQPDINREKAEDYRVIHVSGVLGGHRADHFDVVVQTASINAGESQEKNKTVIDVEDQVCLKLTPEQAKALHKWLGEHIDQYEDQIREIGEVKAEEAEKGREYGGME